MADMTPKGDTFDDRFGGPYADPIDLEDDPTFRLEQNAPFRWGLGEALGTHGYQRDPGQEIPVRAREIAAEVDPAELAGLNEPGEAAQARQQAAIKGARGVRAPGRGGEGTPKDLAPQPKSLEEYQAVPPGTEWVDPEGNLRTKPYEPRELADYRRIPEGKDWVDPEGNVHTKPVYGDISFTAQTVYNMTLTEAEKKKALERYYPGKVFQEPGTGDFYVEDEEGNQLKPRGFMKNPLPFVAGTAAPTAGAVVGEIAGATAGSVLPGPGTAVGAVGGAGVGSMVGQGFNDLFLKGMGIYDRSAGEEAANLGIAGVFGSAGSAIGRATGAGIAGGNAARKGSPAGLVNTFLGTDPEGLDLALAYKAKGGGLLPISMYAKEAPHLINMEEVYLRAFQTQSPIEKDVEKYGEEQGRRILGGVGVTPQQIESQTGSLTKPTAAVPTRETGQAAKDAAAVELQRINQRIISLTQQIEGTGTINVWDAQAAQQKAQARVTALRQRLATLDPNAAPVSGLLPEVAQKAAEDFQRFGVGTSNIRSRIDAIRQNFGDQQAKLFEAEYDRLVKQAVANRNMPPKQKAQLTRAQNALKQAQDEVANQAQQIRLGTGLRKEREAQRIALETEYANARAAATTWMDGKYKEIDQYIDLAYKAAKTGRNTGELWQSIANRFQGLRRAAGAEANRQYGQWEKEYGSIPMPESSALADSAEGLLAGLPPEFKQTYPGLIRTLTKLAPVYNEAGEMIKPPTTLTLGELHDLRSLFRQGVRWDDLRSDLKNGQMKHMETQINTMLRLVGAEQPERFAQLGPAISELNRIDTWYKREFAIWNDQRIRAITKGIENGEPADPKVLYDTMIREGRSDLNAKLEKMLGPNLWAGVKGADAQAIMSAAQTEVPGVIDGNRFISQILQRHRSGLLQSIHGDQLAEYWLQTIRGMKLLRSFEDAKLDIPIQPNESIPAVLDRVRAAAEAKRAFAQQDPIKALGIEIKAARQEQAALKNRPLGFLYDTNFGAEEAANEILKSPQNIYAAERVFGRNSPEFEQLRRTWVWQLLQGELDPTKRLEKVTPEIQQLMMPGVTLTDMQTFAKEMHALLGTRALQETAKSMAAQNLVNNPVTSTPIARSAVKMVPGVNAAARAVRSAYYEFIANVSSSQWLLEWLRRGLNNSNPQARAQARALLRGQFQRYMNRGGATGAGVGQFEYQSGRQEADEPPLEKFAEGGETPTGEPIVVGEEGPEQFKPFSGGPPQTVGAAGPEVVTPQVPGEIEPNSQSSVGWLQKHLPKAIGDFFARREQEALTPVSGREIAGDLIATSMNVLPGARRVPGQGKIPRAPESWKKWTAESDAHLEQWAKAGADQQNIPEELQGRSPGALIKRAQDLGWLAKTRTFEKTSEGARVMSSPSIHVDKIDAIAEGMRAGKSSYQIGKELGIDPVNLRMFVKRTPQLNEIGWSAEGKPAPRAHEAKIEQIADMIRAGKSNAEIAAKFEGLSPQNVNHIIKRYPELNSIERQPNIKASIHADKFTTILESLRNGKKVPEIAEEVGMTPENLRGLILRIPELRSLKGPVTPREPRSYEVWTPAQDKVLEHWIKDPEGDLFEIPKELKGRSEGALFERARRKGWMKEETWLRLQSLFNLETA